MQEKIRGRDLAFMHAVFVIVALGTAANKAASAYPVLSWNWILFYGLNIASLGIYALLWQQVLKRVPLTTAFCNKAVTIVWGMLFSRFFFGESIVWKQLLGAVIVMAGVVLVVSDGE